MVNELSCVKWARGNILAHINGRSPRDITRGINKLVRSERCKALFRKIPHFVGAMLTAVVANLIFSNFPRLLAGPNHIYFIGTFIGGLCLAYTLAMLAKIRDAYKNAKQKAYVEAKVKYPEEHKQLAAGFKDPEKHQTQLALLQLQYEQAILSTDNQEHKNLLNNQLDNINLHAIFAKHHHVFASEWYPELVEFASC